MELVDVFRAVNEQKRPRKSQTYLKSAMQLHHLTFITKLQHERDTSLPSPTFWNIRALKENLKFSAGITLFLTDKQSTRVVYKKAYDTRHGSRTNFTSKFYVQIL